MAVDLVQGRTSSSKSTKKGKSKFLLVILFDSILDKYRNNKSCRRLETMKSPHQKLRGKEPNSMP